MKLSTKQFKSCDMVVVSGRVDSSTAPQLTETLEGITGDGRYKIVLDMSDLELYVERRFPLAALQSACSQAL